jgi:hypothetical protein
MPQNTTTNRGKPASVMQSRRAQLEKTVLAHHLGTALLIASNASDEDADQLQWALDRFDHDRGGTMQDRENRVDATRRIEAQMRLRRITRRSPDEQTTYAGPSVL